MKWVKISAFLVLLAVAALLIAPLLIPKDVALRWVTGAIESRTPLTITLQDIRLAFLPRPSVSLRGVDVKVSVPEKTEAMALFSAASVDIASQWNLIWARQPALDVDLTDADIHLLATGPARFNYTPLLEGSVTQEAQTGLHDVWIKNAWADEEKATSNGAPGILLNRLEIRDSRLHYQAWQEKKQIYPVEYLVLEDVQRSEQETSFHVETQGAFEQLKYGLNFDTQITKMDADPQAWQEILVSSKKTSLLRPHTVSIKDEAIELRSRFREVGKKLELEKGQLKIGPQLLAFNGVRQESGAVDLKIQLATIQMDYLKRILPPVAALPPITNPSASLRYQDSGAQQSRPTISGTLKADSIRLPDYTLNNVTGDLYYRDPKLEIKNLRGQALDGQFDGNAEVNLAEAKPAYRFNLAMQNVAVQQVGSLGKLLTGRGDMKLAAQGQGFDEADWSRNLDGDGNIALRELQLKQLQPFASFFDSPAWQVVNKLPGAVDTKALQSARKLDGQIRDLASQFRIEGGVLHVPDIKLNFPQASAQFRGGIGLDKSLDFNGTLSLDEKLVKSLIKDERLRQALLAGGNALNVPTKITGTISQPLIRPDEAVMQQKVQAYLTHSVQQKATETLQEKLLKPKPSAEGTQKEDTTEEPKASKSPLQDIQDLLKKPKEEK